MAIYMWREWPDYLCFTANTANTVIVLYKSASPTSIELETSTDLNTWNTYIADNDAITLTNIWDKVYIRNKSETPTGFSTSSSNYYYFYSSWSVAVSWDVNTLLCKNSTDTLTSNYCFYRLFYQCPITTAPKLPATTLTNYCYYYMFGWCTSLITPPELPATILAEACYALMFDNCTALTTVPELPATMLADSCYIGMFTSCIALTSLPKLPAITLVISCYREMFSMCNQIKLSVSQNWIYQTPYRIPTEWTWTTAGYALYSMFSSTWWTFTWTPTINTTYYTSNQVI